MSVGYRTLSQHLNDLKKENFNLKLRIYFLEERIQQKYEDSDNEIYKSNIELKVEVESLKRELREKQQVLDEAWSAAENSPGSKESELQELYKQKLEDAEQVQRLLESKIHLLQEEVRLAVNEANKISTLCEAEKKNCLLLTKTIEELTVDMSEARLLQKNYCTALAEKDRMVQNMAMALNNKDTVINELTKKNEKLMNNDIKEFEEVVHHLKTALEQKDGEIKVRG